MSSEFDHLMSSLTSSLQDEYQQYECLFKSLIEETAVLKKSSLEYILESNARKEAILLSLNVASEARRKATAKLAVHLQMDEPTSLKRLIDFSQGDTRKILSQYQEKFSDITGKIKKLNEDNRNLIAFSLTHVRNTFNYINHLVSSNPNYDQRGQIRAGNLQGRLISQAG